jgi:hypothetical protein
VLVYRVVWAWVRWSGLLVGVAACGGGPPHPRFAPQATNALTPIESDPPPGRVETIPPRPAGADAWVDGEWVLQHQRWYWLLGRWVKVPDGAVYAPWVVVRATDGTPYYAPSVWRNASGEAIPAPPGLAFAKASGEAIVSPEGDAEDTGRALKTPPHHRPHPAPPPAPP